MNGQAGKISRIGLTAIICSICWLFISTCGLQAQVYLSGHLNGVLEDTVYIVEDDIDVLEGDSLIIQPGVVFQFYLGVNFISYGNLQAIGTPEDSIKFMLYQDVDSWQGIEINGFSSDTSVMEYCTVTGSNDSGINFEISNPKVRHCTVTGNSSSFDGGGIRCYHSNGYVQDCLVTNNSAEFKGGGITIYNGNIQLYDCRITGNHSNIHSGGIDVNTGCPDARLKNCLVAGNDASSYGAGIWCYYAIPRMINCTVVQNSCPDSSGGIGATGDIALRVINSIVWDNFPDQIVSSNDTTIIVYSDIQSGWPGTGNIDDDPLFLDPQNGNFHLTENSPCIDAGSPAAPLDPDSTIADIGAYYYDQNVGIGILDIDDVPENWAFHPVYPNPFNPSTTISFELIHAGHVELKVFNVIGRETASLADSWYNSGHHSVNFNASELASGIYFVRLESGGSEQTQKLVLLK